MRTTRIAAAATSALVGLALLAPVAADAGTSAPALATPTAAPPSDRTSQSDNKLRPWQRKYEAMRQAALEKQVRGKAEGPVVKLGKGQFARTQQTGRDKIFVVIAEFGRTEHSAYCDPGEECVYPADGTAQRENGPQHNQIPRPDRENDNSTLWKPNYNQAHYDNMYFNRMQNYYERQSTGRYTIGGDVTEWVRVPFNEARYGRNFCGGIVCSNTWFLVRDALAYWVDEQLDSGATMGSIRRYLRTFDKQDRYDFDEDGNFDEADGYIDHFQIVHAGGDEAAGDPIYGTDAIWSHRWYAQINPVGTGPNDGAQFGGVNAGEGGVSDPDGSNVQIPDNKTGVWVGDYTIQPENGGLGVFAHEFAHDLGLPDLYDTSGNTGGAENSTGFWTLMSSGANIGRENDEGIGNHPVDMGAWEKLQLGWLDYDVTRPGQRPSEHKLGALSSDSKWAESLIMLLPNKEVTLQLGDPCGTCGERYFYSGSGDDLDNRMTKEVESGGELTAKVRYDIEEGWDYAFLEASDDGGDTWESIHNSEEYEGEDQSGLNPDGTGISGTSGGDWVDLTADLPADTDTVRWRYVTDGSVAELGFQVDEITIDGTVIGSAETAEGWDFDGFRRTTGTEQLEYLNAYIVENRRYMNDDRSLESAYNFGFLDSRPDWVEHYPYQDGMLVNYWDTSRNDNNVGDHPGSGLILPVDAHPEFEHSYDGWLLRPRILTYDSTFGRADTERITIHKDSQPTTTRSHAAVPVFNDRLNWWFDSDEHGLGTHEGRYQPGWYGVDVPKTGSKIKVLDVNMNTGVMKVEADPTR